MLTLHLSRAVTTAVDPSPRVCQIAAMFGLGVDASRTVQIIPPTDLTLAPGQVVFVTGASGGGKTTLLRLIRHQLAERGDVRIVDFDSLDTVDDVPLVDAFDTPLEDTTRCLALAGLNDAFVMLRKPSQLSDGQRYRFRLARAIAACESTDAPFTVVLADEFGATLDRLTAAVLAGNIRKWTTRSTSSRAGVCFIAATTHDDLLESLAPDTLIVQHPGDAMEIHPRTEGPRARSKNQSPQR